MSMTHTASIMSQSKLYPLELQLQQAAGRPCSCSNLDALREGTNALLHLWSEVPDETLKRRHSIISTLLRTRKPSCTIQWPPSRSYPRRAMPLHDRLLLRWEQAMPSTCCSRDLSAGWYIT